MSSNCCSSTAKKIDSLRIWWTSPKHLHLDFCSPDTSLVLRFFRVPSSTYFATSPDSPELVEITSNLVNFFARVSSHR